MVPVELLGSFLILAIIGGANAIQCYQCDANEDTSCPSYWPFDRNLNALVDCNSFEARIPGYFCIKVTQQSPGWFGWKKITRRCASRSETGVAWGCKWEFETNGVFIERCYCDDRDGCNDSTMIMSNIWLMLSMTIVAVFRLVL